ncbi:hypothetical protein TWF694_010421 [Orbilia ellipsospora]|uniref:Uncharacterized protein n=1 Tax=Orbilia ellipsospora TaxID=2528407 RepID=A0AAV9XA66_9PEZI
MRGQGYADSDELEQSDLDVVSLYTEETPNWYMQPPTPDINIDLGRAPSNFELLAQSPDPYEEQPPSPGSPEHETETYMDDVDAFFGPKISHHRATMPDDSEEIGIDDPDRLVNWGNIFPGSPKLQFGDYESDIGTTGSIPSGQWLYGQPVDNVYINNGGRYSNGRDGRDFTYTIWPLHPPGPTGVYQNIPTGAMSMRIIVDWNFRYKF